MHAASIISILGFPFVVRSNASNQPFYSFKFKFLTLFYSRLEGSLITTPISNERNLLIMIFKFRIRSTSL